MAGMWPRLRAALAEPGLTPTLILSSRAHLTARRRLWGTCQHRQHWASWMSAKGLRGDRVPVRSGFTLGHEAWGQEMIRRGGRRERGPPASDGSRGKCPPVGRVVDTASAGLVWGNRGNTQAPGLGLRLLAWLPLCTNSICPSFSQEKRMQMELSLSRTPK